jgi:hypothetical protein
MTPFNKTEFQHDLSQNVQLMSSNEESINNGQLLNFLTYFEHRSGKPIGIDALLDDDGFVRALRMLMIYNALALALHEAQVYAAAVEVFPLTEIPPQHAPLLLAVLEHIQTNPMQIQSTLEQALSDPMQQRMDLLKQSLLRRLGDHL